MSIDAASGVVPGWTLGWRMQRALSYSFRGVACASLAQCANLSRMTKQADLVGTAEVARILGKSHRTVHRLVESGELVPALVAPGGYSGSFLFTRESVENVRRAQAEQAQRSPKGRRSQKAGA